LQNGVGRVMSYYNNSETKECGVVKNVVVYMCIGIRAIYAMLNINGRQVKIE
jgi:hypothetical protein